VNDADCWIANFWRALAADPDAVAAAADWPPSEADYNARLVWFRERRESIADRVQSDAEWYDTRIAGWWVWGQCAGITGNWPKTRGFYLGPPHGIFADSRADLRAVMERLAKRLRRVRITCGDFYRVLHDWERCAPWGVFLDPPYSGTVRSAGCYVEDDGSCAARARDWALEHGDDPSMRIILCGYDTEHGPHMPASWSVVEWEAIGGMDRGRGDGTGTKNRKRERLWLSPHCLPVTALSQPGARRQVAMWGDE